MIFGSGSMGTPSRSGRGGNVQPPEATTPSQYSHQDHSFNLQMLIEMQRSIGQIGESIQNLDKRIDRLDSNIDKRIDRFEAAQEKRSSDMESSLSNIKTIIAVSGAIIALVVAVGGFFANKAWDIAANHIEFNVKK